MGSLDVQKVSEIQHFIVKIIIFIRVEKNLEERNINLPTWLFKFLR